mmetsp:Transcript_21768/g.32073  ORF Transcript_21768/g.32073 Transcript_21768/m.32073 type:complete len:85 (-) Transcript_21768:482-736(-)
MDKLAAKIETNNKAEEEAVESSLSGGSIGFGVGTSLTASKPKNVKFCTAGNKFEMEFKSSKNFVASQDVPKQMGLFKDVVVPTP